jgi:hypothetical protein
VADLSDLFASLETRATEIVEQTVSGLESRLDRAAPRSGDNAGETLSDTREVTSIVRDGDTLRVEIAYTASYAEVTDTGKEGGYYHIVPVNAEYLVFEGTNDFAGQTIFTKHVWHPPQQGSRWFSDTVSGDIWVTD